MAQQNRYSAIIEMIFFSHFLPGQSEFAFDREEMTKFARELEIDSPKNLGDLVYSFRYRVALPAKIQETAESGKAWIIRAAGKGKYKFCLVPDTPIVPNSQLVETKVPDATPGIVAKYASNDEQALLTKVRYNRLVDIFTGITCYSLQNHLRTTVENMGQVETDEIYVGIDKKGVQYVFPIQAKGGTDRQSIVQIEQDFAICAQKFPNLVCRPIAAQFMQDDVIALFEFEQDESLVHIASERHYRLVSPEAVTNEDLEVYRKRLAD